LGKLDGKIALVTGASRGIGREIALAFAREGADVAANYHKSQAAAEALVAEIGELGQRAVAIHGDMGEPDDIERMVAEAVSAFGRIDILVNNAGFLTIYEVADMPLAEWDAVMATHLRGTFLATQLVLPQMLERRSGKIINIASQLAYKGRAGLAHYCAAKAGMIAFTRVLALEVSRQGVYANCIAPGPIATEIIPHTSAADLEADARLAESLPIGRIGTVEEVAPTAVFLASDDSTYYVGQVLSPNGGDVML
jgi:3-oxoacyl-[acyl-carrier protein] reductase